ncbi:MAG: phosphoribosylformimino-5-aminoimidazole carboxamide ribotide isomerase [Candidatus Latescibacteria bacterium]|nr:phosphoribosylformimino-5-aminoimidazole carboxamide ribotide isomerase [Candidatus Latescibacterota bacterium]
MNLFRPCIDLHAGAVKQIVGGTLRDGEPPQTNFEARFPPEHFAARYRRDGLTGGHVIMLGPGNTEAASRALAAFPQGLHVGGGINPDNAAAWLQKGAQAVIATSFLFADGRLRPERLDQLVAAVGKEHLVIDLSCGPEGDRYVVMTDRWQRRTDFAVDRANLEFLAGHCREFLIHATQMEGLQQGIDADLVALLGRDCPIPATYAGGISSRADIDALERLGQGKLDFTVGSALDLFGGTGLHYADMVAYNRHRAA